MKIPTLLGRKHDQAFQDLLDAKERQRVMYEKVFGERTNGQVKPTGDDDGISSEPGSIRTADNSGG